MEDDLKKFIADPRTECKYGLKCYQKNSQHRKRFKHPPPAEMKIINEEQTSLSPPAKKQKLDCSNLQCEDNFPSEENEKDGSLKEKNEKNESVKTEKEKDDSSKKEEDYSSKEENEKDTPPKEDNDVRNSYEEDEESNLPASPLDCKENIKQKYLVDMPQDFYDFWTLCKTLDSDQPEDAFSCVGLKLVGPYDILSGKFKDTPAKKLSQCLCHWRFYYDPPEFQTVIVGEENEYRIGYFRDDPTEEPAFVASMSSLKQGILSPKGENIFSAVISTINSKVTQANPFKKTIMQNKLNDVECFAKKMDYNLNATTDRMKKRQKLVVSKSFHGAGIVVPVNKDTDVGYREIPETNANLKRILKKIVDAPTKEKKQLCFEDLQELLTNVQFATDEGDFGMGLELGIDLFVYGGEEFHSSIRHLLSVAYELLNRPAFAKIIKAHLQDRRKGTNMSRLE